MSIVGSRPRWWRPARVLLRLHRDHHSQRAAPVHPGRHRARHQAHPRARHHRPSDRGLGHPGDEEPRDGSGGFGLQDALPDPRPGRQVPRTHRRDPRRSRDPDRTHRHPDAADNSIMERWVQTCRRELLDRCLLWNERHLRHALGEYERFYNEHRAHQALGQAAPLRAVPIPITEPARILDLNIRRHNRLGGILHEYSHAA